MEGINLYHGRSYPLNSRGLLNILHNGFGKLQSSSHYIGNFKKLGGGG